MEWMLMPYKRYFDFSGRSRRKEYWMFMLLWFVLSFVLVFALLGTMAGGMAALSSGAISPFAMGGGMMALWIVFMLFGLASLIPSIAVQVRRLHDLDKSGWWLLGMVVVAAVLNSIPRIGGVLYIVAYVAWLAYNAMPGTVGANRFGPDPKDPSGAEVFA
jgi:uncharacterized membrane protein YhaH (DUF805 family)